jgi:hypothetical protein
MNEYPTALKEKLLSIIRGMASSSGDFVKNPEKDFTRKRKLPFEAVMQIIISMGGNSIYKELLEAQGYSVDTATTSAFVQQRDKILPYAFEFLYHKFTDTYADAKDYRGYRLLANDGSCLAIAAASEEDGTYVPNQSGGAGYYAFHLNAMYDLCSRIYVDALIQPEKQMNEQRAITDMVDRSLIDSKAIVIADRGYESYNIFAHIERKGWNYLIRVKDLDSNGILSALTLPEQDEFDAQVQRILTRKQTNEVKAHPETYRFIPSCVTFDYLQKHTRKHTDESYPMSFRVVRFKVTDTIYETVITNLNPADFPPDELRVLYAMRWGIETSFRELKYAVGLTCFHAKKRDYIAQEIFARLILHNFAEMITSHVLISQPDKQLAYQANFTVAIHVCRLFLRSPSNAPPPDVEALIRKNILPVRPGRRDKRKIRPKAVVSFLYRVA